MARFPELELPMDSQGKYGALQPYRGGSAFSLPELNGSSIAVPVSSTPLGASATFTGSTLDRLNLTAGATAITGGIPLNQQAGVLVSKYKGIVYTDQTGTLYVEESNDDTTWTQTATITVSANEFTDSGWVYLSKRYYRLRYVNGSTAQTVFSLFDSAGAGQADTQASLAGSNATIGKVNIQDTGGGPLTGEFPGDGISPYSSPLAVTNFNHLYNGAAYDRQYNNTPGTLLASAVRTASLYSPQLTNYNGEKLIITVTVTNISGTSPGLYIQLSDVNLFGASAKSTVITANGTYKFQVSPSQIASNMDMNGIGVSQTIIPRNFYVFFGISGTSPSFTFSAAYDLTIG